MQTQLIEYHDGEKVLEGYLAFDEKKLGKSPLVMIAHDWTGRNEFACKKAEKLVEWGYAGFALDIYGKNILGKDNSEKTALMQPFMKDRNLLKQRVLAGYEAAKNLSLVDSHQMAVMGFCFGGLVALDLARSGVDLRGVITFHGFLNSPADVPDKKIQAKILAFHGYDDPLVPREQIDLFAKEMNEKGVDWQVHIFGNVKHAFTNPIAHDQQLGLIYNKLADERSWIMTKNFLQEVFT